MLKAEFKVGVLFIKENQMKEEQFFTNTNHSTEFENFLVLLGDRVKLTGFKGYNGGLDTYNGLTGEYSVYKEWGKYKMMFHVSTLLPMEEHDDQKVCIMSFMNFSEIPFWLNCLVHNRQYVVLLK